MVHFLFLVDFAWPMSIVFISIIFPPTLVNSSHSWLLGWQILGGWLSSGSGLFRGVFWLWGWQFFFGVFSSVWFIASVAFLFLWGVRPGLPAVWLAGNGFILGVVVMGGVGTALLDTLGWLGSSLLGCLWSWLSSFWISWGWPWWLGWSTSS